jgi:hypothetical protein
MNQIFDSYLLKLKNTAVKDQTEHTSRAALEGQDVQARVKETRNWAR